MTKLYAVLVLTKGCLKAMWKKRPYRTQWFRAWAWSLMGRAPKEHRRWLRGWVSCSNPYGPKDPTHWAHRQYLAMCRLENTPPVIRQERTANG